VDEVAGRTEQTARRLRGAPAAALVAVAFAVVMLGATLPTPLYPIYEQRLGFGGLMVTVVFAAYAVGVLGSLLLFGGLSDQLGRRPVLLAGLALSAASSAVFLIQGETATLFVGRVLSGLSAGIFTGTATAAIVDYAPEGRGARYSLVAAAVNMLGLGLGPVVAGALAEFAPAPLVTPYAVHLVLVALSVLALLAVADPVTRAGRVRWRLRLPSVPAGVRPTFVRAGTAGFAGFMVLGMFMGVTPSFLGQVLGVHDHLVVGLAVATLQGGATVGQLVSVRMPARTALLAGCVGMTAGMLLIGAALPLRSLALLVGGSVVAGLGLGMAFRAGLGMVTSAVPAEHRGAVSSAFFLLLYVAISLPVIAMGAAGEAFGLIPAGLASTGVVALLSVVAFVRLRRI
jgi:MFS family permease